VQNYENVAYDNLIKETKNLFVMVINIVYFTIMKCKHQIDINLSIEQVLKLINDPNYYHRWQRGLISTELISGKNGETGAKRRIYIRIAGQKVKMIETILDYQPPEKWQARYTTNGMKSIQTNIFKSKGKQITQWNCYSEFNFTGGMILISKVMPQVFKERARITQTDFKSFAENFYLCK